MRPMAYIALVEFPGQGCDPIALRLPKRAGAQFPRDGAAV